MSQKPRDFRLRTALLILGAVLIVITGGLVYLNRAGFFLGGGSSWWILGGFFLLGLLPVLGLMARHRHRGTLVLWCRRFSPPGERVGKRNRWIWAVIREACRNQAIAVTLRDRSFIGSQDVGRSLQNPVAVLLIVVATPLWLWGMLQALDWVEGSLPELIVCVGGLAVYLIMFRAIGWLTVRLTSAFATREGSPETIAKRLGRIHRNRWSPRETDVIWCRDENWQDCVLAVLKQVDYVIIDNVDGSEPIAWEIERSSEIFGADRVFLLQREGSDVPPGVTPVFFPFDEANAEMDLLSEAWGEDDFGEVVAVGHVGKSLAAILRTSMKI